MHVVGHQAVCQDAKFVHLGVLAQQFEVYLAQLARQKYVLPGIPALRNMVRRTNGDDPSESWHSDEVVVGVNRGSRKIWKRLIYP
jgi:hypothetical protein